MGTSLQISILDSLKAIKYLTIRSLGMEWGNSKMIWITSLISAKIIWTKLKWFLQQVKKTYQFKSNHWIQIKNCRTKLCQSF